MTSGIASASIIASVQDKRLRVFYGEFLFIYTALQKFGITLVNGQLVVIPLLRWPFCQEYHTEYFEIPYDKC